MKIGIVGGTGPAGKALALRIASNGHEVTIGSRDVERAEVLAAEMLAMWPSYNLAVSGSKNEDVVRCDLVVLATPWEAAATTVQSLREPLQGKVLISMVNALARVGAEFHALALPRGSVGASIQALLPGVEVVDAFQHLPARELGLIDTALEADVMICSDSYAAYLKVEELVSTITGLRGVYCGSLASANAIEALTAVLLNINLTYKSHVSLKLSGLAESR